MNNNEIGIGILDLYDQDSLDRCLESLNDYKDSIFVASLTNNKIKTENYIRYSSQTPLATLRNYIISQFRIKNLKYYFIIHSNNIIKNKNFANDTIKLGETFGSWVIFGNESKKLSLEDESGLELNISTKLNSEFLFTISGIIKNNGYFDERFFNGKELDIIDYLINLKTKKVYPPNGYHPTIPQNWFEKTNSPINAIGYKDLPAEDKSLQLSYGYFYHKNKYIPNQNEPQPASSDELLSVMEEIQKNYAKK